MWNNPLMNDDWDHQNRPAQPWYPPWWWAGTILRVTKWVLTSENYNFGVLSFQSKFRLGTGKQRTSSLYIKFRSNWICENICLWLTEDEKEIRIRRLSFLKDPSFLVSTSNLHSLWALCQVCGLRGKQKMVAYETKNVAHKVIFTISTILHNPIISIFNLWFSKICSKGKPGVSIT